jgi:benzoyl-CoA reductase/2-hydroxyglutaryl-CoA dehydratase subunit BcrC/BadD/HgdB
MCDLPKSRIAGFIPNEPASPQCCTSPSDLGFYLPQTTLKSVLFTCPFVPVEWIAAHGFQPRGLLPPACTLGAAMGVCAYSEAFLEMAETAADKAVVFTSRCDQMRRAADCATQHRGKAVFLMNLPATWQTPAARQLYRDEMERLGRFLVRLGGSPPSDSMLREIMTRYDQARQALRALRSRLPGRQFADAVAQFHRDGTVATTKQAAFSMNLAPSPQPSPPLGERVPTGQVPVALVGGPLLPGHFEIFDWIEACGGAVALNATLHGERSLLPAFDERYLTQDPRGVLADACFDLPDVFQRPNTRLYDWLRTRLAERGIKGILTWHYSWCDLWRVEIQRLREKFQLPVLELDAGDSATLSPQLQNRIQAFMEMLAA